MDVVFVHTNLTGVYTTYAGDQCERKITYITYKPLTERMLQEPFWLGLLTVFVVMGILGIIWCAKRHVPEKIEKILSEEAERSRHCKSERILLRNSTDSLYDDVGFIFIVYTDYTVIIGTRFKRK